MKRVDCHRPGAIVPSDYRYELSYDMGNTNEIPWNMKAARELCERHNWGRDGEMWGRPNAPTSTRTSKW